MPGRSSCPDLPDASALRPSTRQVILETIHRDEGISKTELVHALGLGWGTVSYHLDRLRRAGSIQTLHLGRCTLAFPTPRSACQMHKVATLRRPEVRRILELLRQRSELTVPAAMEHAGLSRFIVRSCLLDLEEVGILARVGDGHLRFQAPESVGALRRDLGLHGHT